MQTTVMSGPDNVDCRGPGPGRGLPGCRSAAGVRGGVTVPAEHVLFVTVPANPTSKPLPAYAAGTYQPRTGQPPSWVGPSPAGGGAAGWRPERSPRRPRRAQSVT